MLAEPTHAEIVAALTARWPEHRVAPSLGRIRALTELLGDPQRAYPVIHLTGTNGKGSTAAMIESLLRADGLRTGRFTSPHVTSVTERITIDGAPISEERFDATWREIEPYVALVDERQIDGVPMTFFEIITAMAYAAFADAPVDVAVVEVGLGGTWDATNVADAGVAVVTPIDLDHTHLLGDTHHRDRPREGRHHQARRARHPRRAVGRRRRRCCWSAAPRWARCRSGRGSTSG